MSRSVPEWIGESDDAAIPPRVKVRIFDRYGKKCQICTLSIIGKLRPAYDHRVALINGGENREANIQLVCTECHKVKTKTDVALKARAYKRRLKQAGIKKRSRFPGSKDSPFKAKVGGGWERRA